MWLSDLQNEPLNFSLVVVQWIAFELNYGNGILLMAALRNKVDCDKVWNTKKEKVCAKRALSCIFIEKSCPILKSRFFFFNVMILSPLGPLKLLWLIFDFHKRIAYINATQMYAVCELIFFLGQWNTVLLGCVCVCTHTLRLWREPMSVTSCWWGKE